MPRPPLGSSPSWPGRSSTSTLWSVIELAQGSDEPAMRALEQLVERYRPVIRKYLGQRLRDFDPENAEATLAHVVLWHLIQRATRRSHKGSFRRLLRLAVNAYVIDTLRRSTIEVGSWPRVEMSDLIDAEDLAKRLQDRRGAVAKYLCDHLSVSALRQLAAWSTGTPVPLPLRQTIAAALDETVNGPSLWSKSRFAKTSLRKETEELANRISTAAATCSLNRMLLEDAFPLALARRRSDVGHASKEVFDQEIIESVLSDGDDDSEQPGDAMDREFALRTFWAAYDCFRKKRLQRRKETEAEVDALLPLPDQTGRVPSLEELAARLGITTGALKVRQHKARREFRVTFGQYVADIVPPERLDEEVDILERILGKALGISLSDKPKPPSPLSE